MVRTQISLYGDDAEWFEKMREEIAEKRNGTKPSRAETARLMMEQFDP